MHMLGYILNLHLKECKVKTVFHHSAMTEMRRVPFLMLGTTLGRGDKFHGHLHYGENYAYWRETRCFYSTFVL